ncbi:MAG: DUF3365 domain-containing protein [Halochromatium sp.]|uniref:Tll0287-like domain-containing protein n=1 Tax=Halochromatium sp. TaxID=2049430 RepID=UPI003978A17F
MRKMTRLSVTTLLLATPVLGFAETTAGANEEARALIQQFAESLQSELVSAMKEGGPIKAIEVCQDKAPAIADNLSQTSAWEIGRTSLKTRNPENAPDAWETRILKQFESLKTAGNDVAEMSYAEVLESDGQKVYRYMKPIPTQEICLTCHGSDIDPDLAQAIDEAYPEDQARGYSAGDIRGAFTLTKPL